MFEKANHLQDPKSRITPLNSPFFLDALCFARFKLIFIKLRLEILISGVYWLQGVIMKLTMLKNV